MFFCFSPSLMMWFFPPVSSFPAPCYPPSLRNMAARWCVLRLCPAPLPLTTSTAHFPATLSQSVAAVWTQSPLTIILSMTSRWKSSAKYPSLVREACLKIILTRAPPPLLSATMTQQSLLSGEEEDWWITGMSSWPTKHTSCTTRRRPRGNSGSEYSSLFNMMMVPQTTCSLYTVLLFAFYLINIFKLK